MALMESETNGIEMLCIHCGNTFASPRVWHTTLFCSEECRVARKKIQDKEHYLSRLGRGRSVSEVIRSRERSREWGIANRGVKKSQPWLRGQPVIGTHLPGATMAIEVLPKPRWPISLRNTRGLHGALTSALGIGHVPNFPLWSLRMTDLSPSGWSVHWWTEQGVALAKTEFKGHLFDRPTTFRFGQAFRLKAPNVTKRGRRLLQVDTITPVSIANTGKTVVHTKVSATNIVNTLKGTGSLVHRFHLESMQDDICIELRDVHREESAAVQLGGKFGVVRGWEGSFVVETNAIGEWLLRAAAMVGIGSRVAFGLGQIRVKSC